MRQIPILFAVLTLVVGCQSAETRSFEQGSNGTVQYIDEWTEEQKIEARQKVASGLAQDLQVSTLGPGDSLEVLFHLERQTTETFRISPGDKLNVDFFYNPERNMVITVLPDGKITLPLAGQIKASGMTVEELAQHIREAYNEALQGDSIVTVNASEFETPTDDFALAIGEGSEGRSRTLLVGPDGTLILPLITPIKVSGRTITSVKEEIDAAYRERGLFITVTLLPKSFRADRILVFGEVSKPGSLEFDRPQTVLTAIASAGGVTRDGASGSVKVFYVGDDGAPRMRSVNLNNVMQEMAMEEDMLIPDNSVVYVPTTELAETGRFLDSVVRDIFRFNGITFGFNYVLNQETPSSSAAVVVPP
jgi:polysaccharide export outer membrane protein